MQRLKRFAGVDMQQTSDEDLGCQKLIVVMMDRCMAIKRSLLMKNLAVIRRYISDSGLMEVVTPYGRN